MLNVLIVFLKLARDSIPSHLVVFAETIRISINKNPNSPRSPFLDSGSRTTP